MKIVVLVLLMMTMALAEYEQDGELNGYLIYQKKCQMCHKENLTKKVALSMMDKLKAPPMNEVSARMKERISAGAGEEDVTRELILTFMRDYIIHPSIDKSMCHMGAIDKFDIMPSQKGKLNDEELHAVTEWIHDHYEGKVFK